MSKSDDLISRQAAIDVIDKIFPADPMRNDYTQGITCGAALAEEYIKQLPSAQQDCTECAEYDTERHYCPKYCEVIRKTVKEAKQERTGRWMATEADDPCFYRCSECGRLIDERENFCPNCGARMEDETNG